MFVCDFPIRIDVLVCLGVTSLSAGDCLLAELNQPLLSRVAAYEPQERRWNHIYPLKPQLFSVSETIKRKLNVLLL